MHRTKHILPHPAQARIEKSRPSASGASQKREKPAHASGRQKEIRKFQTFSDALAQKGGPAPNTAICDVLTTFGLQCIGHANLCIGFAKLCIEQNTPTPHPHTHPAQARSEKSRRSASGAGQKREKAGPAPVGAREKYANSKPFRTLLLKRAAQHQSLLSAMF
jgi:hypothetical protein